MYRCLPLILLCASCHLAEEYLPDLPSTPLEIASDTRLPEEADGFRSARVEESRIIYEFSGAPDEATFAPGKVIIGASEGGYLRRVERVEREGDSLVVYTQPAALEEVITRGELSVTADSGAFDAALGCPAGATCRSIQLVDLANRTLFEGEVEGVPVQIEILEGTVDFDPQVTVDMGFDKGKLQLLSSQALGTLDANMNLRMTVGGPVHLDTELDLSGPELPLFSYPFTVFLPTPLGPLPVVGRLDVDAFAGVIADIDAQTSATVGVEVRTALDLEARYESGAWSFAGEPGFMAIPQPPVLEGAASLDIEIYVRPEVSLVLYGMRGTNATLRPSQRVIGDFAPPAEPEYDFDGCLVGAIEVGLDVFSLQLPDYQNSIERCVDLSPSVQDEE